MNLRGIGSLCILLSFLFSSCKKEAARQSALQERAKTNAFIDKYRDSVFLSPARIGKLIRQKQAQSEDSNSYYKLELYEAFCLYLENKTDSCQRLQERAITFCNTHADTEDLKALYWKHRGLMLQAGNQRDSAIACMKRSVSALRQTAASKELVNAYIDLADMYRQKGDFAQTATYYREALFDADSLHLNDFYLPIYTGLGQAYADLYNFNLADRFFHLAQPYANREGISYDAYLYYNSKGNNLYYQKRYDEARKCFLKTLAMARKLTSVDNVVLIADVNLAEISLLTNHPDEGKLYLDNADSCLNKCGQKNAEVVYYINSLKAYYLLQKKKPAAAAAYLSAPTGGAKINPHYVYLHNKRLMEYYVQKNDYRNAFRYQTSVNRYNDSLRNTRYMANLVESEMRYSRDTALLRRNVTIAQNHIDMDRQKWLLLAALTLLVVAIVFSYLINVNIRRKNKLINSRQHAKLMELKIQNVRNHVSPHFVFNVLNAVLPSFRQFDALTHPLELLIDMLRSNLINSEKMTLPLREEMAIVNTYASLRKETNPQTPPIHWNVAELVDLESHVPTMFIQIPVENALKYAFPDTLPPDGLIDINIEQSPTYLLITIEDNGRGFDYSRQKDAKSRSGNGLKVIYQTIDILNRQNKEQASFDLVDKKQTDPQTSGVKVDIKVPLQYNYNF